MRSRTKSLCIACIMDKYGTLLEVNL